MWKEEKVEIKRYLENQTHFDALASGGDLREGKSLHFRFLLLGICRRNIEKDWVLGQICWVWSGHSIFVVPMGC